MKRKESDKSKEVSAKINEVLKPYRMMQEYKKTLQDQTPNWVRQRRDYKNKNKMPGDRIIEAEKFRRDYLRPFKQPKGLVAEMFKQATETDLDD